MSGDGDAGQGGVIARLVALPADTRLQDALALLERLESREWAIEETPAVQAELAEALARACPDDEVFRRYHHALAALEALPPLAGADIPTGF